MSSANRHRDCFAVHSALPESKYRGGLPRETRWAPRRISCANTWLFAGYVCQIAVNTMIGFTLPVSSYSARFVYKDDDFLAISGMLPARGANLRQIFIFSLAWVRINRYKTVPAAIITPSFRAGLPTHLIPMALAQQPFG